MASKTAIIKNMNKNKTFGLYIKIVFCTFALSLLVFACIYLFDVMDLPSKLGIVDGDNSKTWLEYSIEYFGPITAAFISFIGAIMAVSVSLNKETEFRKEDNRKNVLPLIKIKEKNRKISLDGPLSKSVKGADGDFNFPIIELARDNETMMIMNLSIENVGQREMYDVWIGGVNHMGRESKKYCRVTPVLYRNEKYTNCVFASTDCPRDLRNVTISFRVYYRDCYDNWYYQIISGTGSYKPNSYLVDTFMVDGAPVLIKETMLPKDIISPSDQ